MFLYSPTSFANDLEKDVYNAYTKKIENMELDKQISVSKWLVVKLHLISKKPWLWKKNYLILNWLISDITSNLNVLKEKKEAIVSKDNSINIVYDKENQAKMDFKNIFWEEIPTNKKDVINQKSIESKNYTIDDLKKNWKYIEASSINDYWLLDNRVVIPHFEKYVFNTSDISQDLLNHIMQESKWYLIHYTQKDNGKIINPYYITYNWYYKCDFTMSVRWTEQICLFDNHMIVIDSLNWTTLSDTKIFDNQEDYIRFRMSWAFIWIESTEAKTMNEISKLSKEITKDMTSDEEKIRAIYSWITTNIKYDNDTLNARLASTDSPDALNTFNKRKWICHWVASLYVLMLTMVDVKASYVRGDFIAFQNPGHSWVKIWDYEYDPTRDLWLTWNYAMEYFKLPHDVMVFAHKDIEFYPKTLPPNNYQSIDEYIKINEAQRQFLKQKYWENTYKRILTDLN